MATLEEQYAAAVARVESLKIKLAEKAKREKEQNQKWRSDAAEQIGTAVMESASLDWTRINPKSLFVWITEHGSEIRAACVLSEAVEPKTARKQFQETKTEKTAKEKNNGK